MINASDCQSCIELSIKVAAHETTLQCDQCGAVLEWHGAPERPDEGPCAMCFEIAQYIAEWERPSAWMRCDDCHSIVTISPAMIKAKPHPVIEASTLLGIAEDLALGIAPAHSIEQLHKVMHYSPQEGATLQWLISKAGRQFTPKLFIETGHHFADPKQLKAWKHDAVRGTDAAKIYGKSLLDAALVAWAKCYPRLPSRASRIDHGRPILVFDLSCYDNSQWISWKKVKKSIQEFDRQASLRHSTACNSATRVSDVATDSSDCSLRPLPTESSP